MLGRFGRRMMEIRDTCYYEIFAESNAINAVRRPDFFKRVMNDWQNVVWILEPQLLFLLGKGIYVDFDSSIAPI